MVSLCQGLHGLGVSGDCLGTELRNSVSGFRYGIVSLSSRLNIQKNDFNNYRSIYMLNSNFGRISENIFEPIEDVGLFNVASSVAPIEESWLTHYGVYMDMSSAYWVEDNIFDMSIPIGAAPADRATLIVRGSGPAQNLIYRNSFSNSTVGTFAYDDNRGMEDVEGLKIACNTYEDNNWDINVSPALFGLPNWGISEFQGYVNDFGEIESAGNKFDLASGLDVELELENNLDNINYFRHASEQFEDYDGIAFPQLGEERVCSTQLTTGHTTKALQAELARGVAEDARNLLNSLLDGGNTQALMTEVILTQYGEALKLYYELSAMSPYLSEEVLIKTIQKETELPPLLLALILESNPHAAKSDAVQKKLDERSIPLSEYLRDMIDQGLYVISSKEELTARLSYYDTDYQTILHQGVRLLLSDVNESNLEAAISTYVSGMETLDLRYLLIDLAIEQDNYTGASSLLNTISADFNLDQRKDEELQDFIIAYTMLIALKVYDRYALTESELASLKDITEKQATRAAGLAKSILLVYRRLEFPEILVHPNSVAKSIKRTRKLPNEDKSAALMIFPNPTSDYVIVCSAQQSKVAFVQITDNQGRILLKEASTSASKTQIISVSNLSPAQYEIELIDADGVVIDVGSLIINR